MTEYLQQYFSREIFPALTPLAFDPGHPFPFISNLSQNLAVAVKHAGKTRFARVKIPDVLPRFVPLPRRVWPGDGRGVRATSRTSSAPTCSRCFPGTQVQGAYLFRVVRDADLVIQEDEADDLLESVDQGLKQRRRGALSMLQVEAATPRRVLDILIENFEIEEENVYRTDDRLGFGDWMQLTAIAAARTEVPAVPADVAVARRKPKTSSRTSAHRDRLVHHPVPVLRRRRGVPARGGQRPARHRDQDDALPDRHRLAADRPARRRRRSRQAGGGAVELKARFDERNNIKWAHRLEAAGVHVVYGLVNLKTHCKLCLVVRKEADGIRRYVHVGTGNYNAQTARVYTDLGLFTARADIVDDVVGPVQLPDRLFEPARVPRAARGAGEPAARA